MLQKQDNRTIEFNQQIKLLEKQNQQQQSFLDALRNDILQNIEGEKCDSNTKKCIKNNQNKIKRIKQKNLWYEKTYNKHNKILKTKDNHTKIKEQDSLHVQNNIIINMNNNNNQQNIKLSNQLTQSSTIKNYQSDEQKLQNVTNQNKIHDNKIEDMKSKPTMRLLNRSNKNLYKDRLKLNIMNKDRNQNQLKNSTNITNNKEDKYKLKLQRFKFNRDRYSCSSSRKKLFISVSSLKSLSQTSDSCKKIRMYTRITNNIQVDVNVNVNNQVNQLVYEKNNRKLSIKSIKLVKSIKSTQSFKKFIGWNQNNSKSYKNDNNMKSIKNIQYSKNSQYLDRTNNDKKLNKGIFDSQYFLE